MSEQTRRNPLGDAGNAVIANVIRFRLGRRMSLREMSDALRRAGHPILPGGLSKLENGTRRVDVDDLAALAKVLGVEPVDLLTAPADVCPKCLGAPPAGFTCNSCDRAGA